MRLVAIVTAPIPITITIAIVVSTTIPISSSVIVPFLLVVLSILSEVARLVVVCPPISPVAVVPAILVPVRGTPFEINRGHRRNEFGRRRDDDSDPSTRGS